MVLELGDELLAEVDSTVEALLQPGNQHQEALETYKLSCSITLSTSKAALQPMAEL